MLLLHWLYGSGSKDGRLNVDGEIPPLFFFLYLFKFSIDPLYRTYRDSWQRGSPRDMLAGPCLVSTSLAELHPDIG